MDFLKILRSFEEFLFEAASWLIFYPLTMWRIVRNPLAAMDYSDREQADDEAHRYDDALSPPLVLLATIVIVNALATALHVPAERMDGSELLHTVTASPQNLMLFRSLVFSLIPLVAAASLLHRQGKKISRESLLAPFYAQCYLAAPCAVFVSAGGVVFQRPDVPNALGLAMMAGGGLWFLAVQTTWFRNKLATSWTKATLIAAWAVVRALVFLIAILIPIALI